MSWSSLIFGPMCIIFIQKILQRFILQTNFLQDRNKRKFKLFICLATLIKTDCFDWHYWHVLKSKKIFEIKINTLCISFVWFSKKSFVYLYNFSSRLSWLETHITYTSLLDCIATSQGQINSNIKHTFQSRNLIETWENPNKKYSCTL